MSTLAGFDFVTEISNATILKLIKNSLQIGGVSVNPPFEVTLPFVGGSGHLIVDDLQLNFNNDDTMTLLFVFSHSSIAVQSPLKLVVCPLSGTLKVTAPIKLVLVSSQEHTYKLSASMGESVVDIVYTPQAEQEIINDLAGLINAAQFKTMVRDAVTGFVHSVPEVTLPMSFKVVPGTNGSFSPLQFSSLQVHCIGNNDPSRQALGIFGNLLASTQNNGNHANKTSTAIMSGRDMATSISPGAFHALVFCPSVASSLNLGQDNLPPSCGGSGGVDVGGVTLNSIADSFGNEQININGSVYKSGFCYEANGTFSGSVTLAVNGTSINPTISMNDPNVDISIPWYCWIAIGVVLGPIGIAVAAILDSVLDDVANNLAKSALKDALGSGIGSVGLGGLSGATFSSVSIKPDGLTLQGMIPVYVSSSSFYQALYLDGSVTTSSKSVVSTGAWTTKIWCKEEEKTYPYTEYAQSQVATEDITAKMLTTPISATYTVRRATTPSTVIALSGNSGSVTIPDVECTYPMPLGSGGHKVTQPVHIDYQINGTLVKLRNRAEEGNFSIILEASVLDCSGSTPVVGSYATPPQDWIVFQGSSVEVGGSYLDDYQECAAKFKDWFSHFNDQYKKWKWQPKWVLVNYPAPDAIFDLIRILTEIDTPLAQEMLLHTRVAHGSSFVRAYHSPTSVQLDKAVTVSAKMLDVKATETDLKAQIVMLTDQLKQVEQVIAFGDRAKMSNKLLG